MPLGIEHWNAGHLFVSRQAKLEANSGPVGCPPLPLKYAWIQLCLWMAGVSWRLLKSQEKVQVIYCVFYVPVFSSIPPSLLSCLLSILTVESLLHSELHSWLLFCGAAMVSHVRLCNAMGCSPWDFPGMVTGVGCPFLLQGSWPPRDQTCISCVSCIAGGFFSAEPPGKPSGFSTHCPFLLHFN